MMLRIILLAALGMLAHAHFVFVVPEPGSAKAKVIISEDLKPAGDVGIGIISGAKLRMRAGDGKDTPMEMEKGADCYLVTLPGQGTRLVLGFADLGYTKRGAGKAHLLLYHPKTILGDAFDKSTVAGTAPVEIIPAGKPGAMRLLVAAKGKPLPDAEVTVILPDGTQKKLKTDAAGLTDVLTASGRYGAWARFWEPGEGERDGKKYEELRHYATLVFDVPEAVTARRYATMPEAAASFGSVVSDGYLYVYGGHIAVTHSYSREAVSGKFHRLALDGTGKWETLPGGPAMQGMNLAAYGRKIYRIGGMSPRNYPGEPSDVHSVADCAVYDPAARKWSALPALPEARSSHDVVVIGDRLFVTGGWSMMGKDGQKWFETVAVLDLRSSTPVWKSVAQPFKRRALMAAAFEGKMYVIGGFDDKGRIVREVSIYDPVSNAWSEGAKLPAGAGLSFAPAAGEHAGSLYVSVSDGTLLRLHSGAWAKVGKASPRLAHRLASAGDSVLVIGGAEKGRNSDLVEAVLAR